MKSLWLDECGAVLTTELILLVVVLVIGIAAGMVVLRDAVIAELCYVGQSIVAVDASYTFPGVEYTDPTGFGGSHTVIGGSLWDNSSTSVDSEDFDYPTAISDDPDPDFIKTAGI